MSVTAYAEMIQRLEPQAVRNPLAYRRRVIALALAGNAYVLLCFLILAGLAAAAALSIMFMQLLGLKLLLIFGAALWVALRALWITVPEPRGLRIRAQEAPELFAMIEDIRRKLDVPGFHHVLLNNDFNASVVQVPRFGLFGGTRNFLTIGLPLLKGTTAAQARAVLAHEFGHLSRNHAKIGNWIYRQRLRWARLAYAFEAGGQSGGLLFTPFLKRFLPYFNAYSFPLARANEYEADATSAQLTDPATAASALTAVYALGQFLEERYWPDIYARAAHQPEPDAAPLQEMPEAISSVSEDRWQHWIDSAMAQASGLDDTHPGLADRLAALQQPPKLCLPAEGDRADRLLGEFNATISREYDQDWLSEISPGWHSRFNQAQEDRARLLDLDRQAAEAPLDAELAIERALLTESLGTRENDALIQLRELMQRRPDFAMAHFHYGARLLSRGDADGESALREAMRLDEELTLPVAERLMAFHRRRGDGKTALHWERALESRSELEQRAAHERQHIRTSDKFDRHGLDGSLIAAIRGQLSACPDVRKAYLVRKRLKTMSHKPQFALALRVTPFYRLHREERARRAVADVLEKASALPPGTLVFCADGENSAFASRFRWMRGSRIY